MSARIICESAPTQSIPVTSSKTTIFEANDGRQGFLIVNEGANDAVLYFDGQTAGITLKADGGTFTDLGIAFRINTKIEADSASGTTLKAIKFKQNDNIV